MIEYAILTWDEAARAYSVAEVRRVKAPLRARPAERVPVRTVTERRVLTLHDAEHGRAAETEVEVTFELPAVVDPAEIKRGPDGGLMARPIIDVDAPDPHPWQTREGPIYTIRDDEVERSWRIVDRPVALVQARRAEDIRIEQEDREKNLGDYIAFAIAMRKGDPDGIIDKADLIRRAARQALKSLPQTPTAEAAYNHPVEWPVFDPQG